jgi:hypothetical protein
VFFKSLVFLFLLYNVKFTTLGGIGSSYIVFLYFIIIAFRQGKLINISGFSLLILSVLFCLSLVTFIVYSPYSDFGLLKFVFISLISILVSGNVYRAFFHNRPVDLFRVIGYAGIINAIMIVLMLVSPMFQNFYLNFVIVEAEQLFGNDILSGFFSLRMVGVTGFATYSTAFTQCLCAFSYYIYASNYSRNNGERLNIRNYLIMLLILSSALIAARSAFVGVLLLFFIMLCDKNSRRKNIVFFGFCVCVFIVMINFLASYFPSEKTEFFIQWITELLNKGTEVGSVQKIGDMFRFKYFDFSFFGEAKLNSSTGGYYMGVDIGYLRLLFAAGYFGLFLIFLVFVSSIKPNKISRLYLMYTLFIFLLISAFMVKGLIIFDAFYILIYVLLTAEAFRQLSLQKILSSKAPCVRIPVRSVI